MQPPVVPEPSPPQPIVAEPKPPQHRIDAVNTIAGIVVAALTGIGGFLHDFGLQEGKEAVVIGGGIVVVILFLLVLAWVARYNGLL